MCSNCTLLKNALLPTIGYTRVRVCVSCVFNHAHSQKVRVCSSPHVGSGGAQTISSSASSNNASPTQETREWLSSHLHSPLSKSDEIEYDSEDYADSFNGLHNNQYQQPQARRRPSSNNNQYTHNQQKSPSYRTNQQDASETTVSPTTKWSHPWPKPPVAADEASRLQALHALDVLDSAPEKPYDMICDLAKARLSCPMAAVSFMDEHRQWFKASVGLAHKMIPRKIAFCAYTVFTKEPVVVLDTLKDKRFECNPLVSGAAAVRFYAAAPIIDPSSGHAVGSVFVLDTRPRESCDIAILERLAHAASENLPQLESCCSSSYAPLSPAPSTASLSSTPSSAAASPTSNNSPAKAQQPLIQQQSPPASSNTLTTMLSTAVTTGNDGAVVSGEQMEVLLMRLLTQNTETQQQLATQQISISNTLGFHSTQINKLMTDFARMEAKIEAKIK